MRYRLLALLVLTAALASPLAARFRSGDVLIETGVYEHGKPPVARTSNTWLYLGSGSMVGFGWALIYKYVPLLGYAGNLLAPTPKLYLFHDRHDLSWWDGMERFYTEPGKGYFDILHDDAELTEIAPRKSGNWLVAERSNDAVLGAKLIEFNLQGPVAEYPFPPLIDTASGRALGAAHIELLADNCTLLYTLGHDTPANNRVLRFNICTGQALSDFAPLRTGEYAGSIRQLPSGDVLVANGTAVLQFTSSGTLLRSYPIPGVTHLALTPEGNKYWAASVEIENEIAHLYLLDPAAPDGAPKAATIAGGLSDWLSAEITNLNVVGEWRAAAGTSPGRVRAVRR